MDAASAEALDDETLNGSFLEEEHDALETSTPECRNCHFFSASWQIPLQSCQRPDSVYTDANGQTDTEKVKHLISHQ